SRRPTVPTRRGAARSARGLRDREHLDERVAMAGAALAVAASRGREGRGARRRPRLGAADDARVGRRNTIVALGLPPGRPPVPALRRDDPLARPRRREPHRVLVRTVPAGTDRVRLTPLAWWRHSSLPA